MSQINYYTMNAIDRSIIGINQIVPEIMDRMLEIYKAYAPQILETISKRLDENGGRLAAYKHELVKNTDIPRYQNGIPQFLNEIPFTSLVKIVEPTIHKTFMAKIGEISDWCNKTSYQRWQLANNFEGNNEINSLQMMVERAVRDTEGFQKFTDYELTGVYPGRIPTYGVDYYSINHTGKEKNSDYNKGRGRYYNLPVIGVYNKFNANLFNKIFAPEARILRNSGVPGYNGDSDYIDEFDFKFRGKRNDLDYSDVNIPYFNQNQMLIDIDSIFNTIARYWSQIFDDNVWDISTIDEVTRREISKITQNKALYPHLTNDKYSDSYIASACRTFVLLSLNATTSPEYKQYFREFDILHKHAVDGWGLIKRQVVASAITTYLANVCSRTQNFANNMLDDVVNKYLSITSQDNSIISQGGGIFQETRHISTVRSKARDFYSLFRNFLTTPTLDKRNMLNIDDIAIKTKHGSAFHMSVKQFACYILKKIYEHECVTYNTSYNISNTDTNFKFVSTENMAKKMLTHVYSPESKAIIEMYKDFIGVKSLIGYDQLDLTFWSDNKCHPLAYLARNHRALSSVYKQLFVAFINYIDVYRLKKNISRDNLTATHIRTAIVGAQNNFFNTLKLINDFCCGRFDVNSKAVDKLRTMTNWLVSPIFNIGLYYDGQFHINYNVIDTHRSMLIQPFCNRIIDVLTPKNLRRENVGYNCSRFVTSPQPICEDDGQEACGYCCCDGGDLTCQNGTNILSDIDDLSADDIKNKLGLSIWSTSNSKPTNTEISQTPYTDFGQIDAELDSGINSYESLSSKLEWKTAKIPSLKAIEKVALKLNNLKSIKPLDLATVAYSAQLAYEQLDFNKLSDKDKMIANKRLKVIDSKLRDVLDGRIYNSIEELNTNSMESIDFVDSID